MLKNIFQHDYRRLPKTTEEDPKMFRSYTIKISFFNNDIFTCKSIISFNQFVQYTTRYTTDLYIITPIFEFLIQGEKLKKILA